MPVGGGMELPMRIRVYLPPGEKQKLEKELSGSAGIRGGFPGGVGGGAMAGGAIRGPQPQQGGGIGAGDMAMVGAMEGVGAGIMGSMLAIAGPIAVIAGVLKGIDMIINNEFSAMSELVDLMGTLTSLYIKPISDMLFLFMKPFVIAFMKILPFWYDFMADPSKGFLPLVESIGREIITALGEVFGWTDQEIQGLIGVFNNDVMPAAKEWADALSDVTPELETLSSVALPATILAIKGLAWSIEVSTANMTKTMENWDKLMGSIDDIKGTLHDWDVALAGAWFDFIQDVNALGAWIDNINWNVDWSRWLEPLQWGHFVPDVKWSDFIPDFGGGGFFNDFIIQPGKGISTFSPTDTVIGLDSPSKFGLLGSGGGGGGGTIVTIEQNFYGPTSEDVAEEMKRELLSEIQGLIAL